jgi:hypothetical protein
MYILTFKQFKSKYFQKALKHALKLGASWDGEIVTITIPEKDLPTAYERLLDLFYYIIKWNSTRATFK